jgi:hypothetical protein
MVGRKYIGKKPPVKPRLLIQQRFFDNLHTIEMYGATLFGEKVAEQFHKGIMTRITALPSLPKANPKFRFVPSTEKKRIQSDSIQEILCSVLCYKQNY